MKNQPSVNPFSRGTKLHGNAEALDILEKAVEFAKLGDICWAAVAMAAPGDIGGHAWAGNDGLLPEGMKIMRVLYSHMKHRYEGRITGEGDPNKDASMHEYNLAVDPKNFDFLIWLIDAEMTRVRNDAPWPLQVGFSHEEELSEWGKRFFSAVMKPLLTLIGAVENPDAIGGLKSSGFTPSNICLAAKRGEKVPLLYSNEETRSSVKAWLRSIKGGQPPVVITLREATHYGENSAVNRNSNIGAWTKFARDLERKGASVIFVRDTEKANEPLEDFVTFPMGSFSIQPRMALVELAKCNLYVANGPAGLGLFSNSPYLYFQALHQLAGYEPSHNAWWIRANGIGEGDQWPWALPTQRMVWLADDYKNISAAWEEFSPLFESGASDVRRMATPSAGTNLRELDVTAGGNLSAGDAGNGS